MSDIIEISRLVTIAALTLGSLNNNSSTYQAIRVIKYIPPPAIRQSQRSLRQAKADAPLFPYL